MIKGKVGNRGRILGNTGESRNKLGEYRKMRGVL